MKILLHDYAGHAFPAQLSRELARRGHEVVHAFAQGLLTPRGELTRKPGDPMTLWFVAVPMHPGYREGKYSFIKRRSYEVGYGRELRRLVEREDPDVILSGQTPTEPQWTMMRAARECGIPVVIWQQDFYSLAVERLARRMLPVLGHCAGWWYRWLDARCFSASEKIVAITSGFLPMLERFGVPAEKVEVIPNWGPIQDLPVRPRANPWAERVGLVGKFVFLYSGTLAMKHNPKLLEELAKHFSGDDKVRVVVVSEGPGAEYLAARKRSGDLSNLLLLPFQEFSVMPEVHAAADVLVAVLEADAGQFSVPSKVLSYLCAGRPVLGSIPEDNLAASVLKQSRGGVCASAGDTAAFLDAAGRLRASQRQREEMGGHARRYAEKEFDIARIGLRFEAVLSASVRAGVAVRLERMAPVVSR